MTRHRRYRMRRKTRLRLRAPAVTLFLLACLLSLDGTGVLRTGLLCAILHESAHALVYRKLWHRWPDLALSPFGICLQLRGVPMTPEEELRFTALTSGTEYDKVKPVKCNEGNQYAAFPVPEKPRSVQGVNSRYAEYIPEQQAESTVGRAVYARYSVWVYAALCLPHPRRLAAARGRQTEVVPRTFALCQISHLAGAFIFALAATNGR